MDDMTFKLLELNGKGYCCSQIMLMLALDMQGRSNPDLVRTMSGLCHGIGFSGNVCGVLTGGICLISYYAGKGADTEINKPGYATMLTDLVAWFNHEIGDRYGGTTCSAIMNGCPDKTACKDIMITTFNKALDLLIEHNYDPLDYAP